MHFHNFFSALLLATPSVLALPSPAALPAELVELSPTEVPTDVTVAKDSFTAELATRGMSSIDARNPLVEKRNTGIFFRFGNVCVGTPDAPATGSIFIAHNVCQPISYSSSVTFISWSAVGNCKPIFYTGGCSGNTYGGPTGGGCHSNVQNGAKITALGAANC